MNMRATSSLAIPQTQNTAPVLEFNCLYTHDIRRKQKRWQDGFLRFHTFNKRIMVYDMPRNFIGDAHWNAEELHDGAEVTLEKGGVLVQVAEIVGRTETDLSELLRDKKKRSGAATSSSPIHSSTHRTRPHQPHQPSLQISTNTVQLKHRSLNALLGTPRGRIGKAVLPTRSPFEDRREAENEPWNSGRPQKKQRIGKSPMEHRAEVHGARIVSHDKAQTMETVQQRRSIREIVDLRSDSSDRTQFMVEFSDDALPPSQSSPRCQSHIQDIIPCVRSSSPAFQRQKTPAKAKMLRRMATTTVHAVKAPDCVKKNAQERDFASSKSRRSIESGTDAESWLAVRSANHNSLEAEVLQQDLSQNDDHDGGLRQLDYDRQSQDIRPGRTLRMAANAPKRKTLLCHNQLSAKSTHTSDSGSAGLLPTPEHVAFGYCGETRQRRQLEQRLARVEKKRHLSPDKTREQGADLKISRTAIAEASDPPSLSNLAGVAEPADHDAPAALSNQQRSSASPMEPSAIHRQLRRVVSESGRMTNGDSDRTLEPAGRPRPPLAAKSLASATERSSCLEPDGKASRTTARPAPRVNRPMNRAVSLNLATNGASTVILNREFRLPKPPKENAAVPNIAANPWTREAFDLFTWRPPGWDEESWCVKADDAMAIMQT